MVAAPEFGLKEVGSLFIYIVAAAPFFLTSNPKKVEKTFSAPLTPPIFLLEWRGFRPGGVPVCRRTYGQSLARKHERHG